MNGKGNMPAFPQFSEEETNAILAYLERDDKELEHSFSSAGKIKYSSSAPFFSDPEGYPAIEPPWGTFNAIDLAKGGHCMEGKLRRISGISEKRRPEYRNQKLWRSGSNRRRNHFYRRHAG